jgi:hypothetical protein
MEESGKLHAPAIILPTKYIEHEARDSVVGIVTGYGLELDNQGVGVGVPVGVRIFASSCRPDRLWGPTNLLSNGYRVFFPRG